jgi:hypothetical protein
MASQLHEAVRLAQAGQREEARRLLWQVVQTEPNHEIAWLWLASVAADLPEYERALTEVLRINPGNAQAQRLLAEYHEQFGAVSPAQPPVSPGYTALPTPQTPPPMQYPTSRPQAPVGYGGYPATPGGYAPEYPPAPPVQQQQPAPPPARRSGFPGCLVPMGCGCGGGCLRSCLVALFIFVVVPVIIIGILAFGRFSFGPLDLVMQYLPGDVGRKDVEFTLQPGGESERPTAYDVSVTVPRSWFPAVSQNQWWVMGRDLLDDFVVLAETRASWRDLGVDLDSATPSTAINIVELNPFRLRDAGSPLLLTFGGITTADTTSCDAPDAELVRRGALCGRRSQATEQVTETIFRDYAPPTEIRVINFSVPVAENLVANWTIELPADLYGEFEDDIARIIDSAQVEPR